MRRSTHFQQFVVPGVPSPAFEPLGNAEVVGRSASGVRLRSGATIVEVAALADDLFRVGIFGFGRPVEYRSEAVARLEWGPTRASVSLNGLRLSTPLATARIGLRPLRVGFEDEQGRA